MKIITHSGTFHSDEILATAAIQILMEKRGSAEAIEVFRTRDEKMMKQKAAEDFVLDVGFVCIPEEQRFDHHQPGGAGKRENGIPYATFGLIWKEYGLEICGSKEAADQVDVRMVSSIDATDNGIEIYHKINDDLKPYMFDQVISSFKPTWQEEGIDADQMFNTVLPFAKLVLEREIIKAKSFVEGKAAVEKAYIDAEDKRIILLDRNYQWGDIVRKFPEVLFVILNNGVQTTWAVSTVSNGKSLFQSRKLFPKSWAGKTGTELAAVSGVRDANFCHNNRFLAIANSKEGALELARRAVEA